MFQHLKAALVEWDRCIAAGIPFNVFEWKCPCVLVGRNCVGRDGAIMRKAAPLMGRPNCEAGKCFNRAVLRKFFVDPDGYWTWLCQDHFERMVHP